MQPCNVNTMTFPETATDDTSDQSAPPVSHEPPLTQYINDHKLPHRAANDSPPLALSEFLFEHMQQRANAKPE